MDPPSYQLTDEEKRLVSYIYPDSHREHCLQMYVALRTFLQRHQRYPNDRGQNGRKLRPSDPERQLYVFIEETKRNRSPPAKIQLFELVPNWTWVLY